MRKIVFLMSMLFCIVSYAQKNTKMSSIGFVQILNNNKKEAVYYYKNNWEVLRKMAVKKSYIHSYVLLETQPTKEAPFSFMLVTTYKNQKQFTKREKHFQELIKIKGNLKLLNDKKPSEFRKTLFNKKVYHKES